MANADAPVAPGERYDSLDVLRGVAVLMIFSVNVRHMLMPFFEQGDPTAWGGPNDLAIDQALQLLVDGKWIAVFAILFGAGLALLRDKVVAAGADPTARIVRRQAWLIGFGLIHLLLIWLGDVLVTYGVVGLVAMTLLGKSGRTVALWAAFGLLLGTFLVWGNGAITAAMGPAAFEEGPMSYTDLLAAEVEAKSGGVLDQLAWRTTAGALLLTNTIVAGPTVLGYMAVGILAFRSGFLLARWPGLAYAGLGVLALLLAWAIDAWRIDRMGVWNGAEARWLTTAARYQWVGIWDGLLGGLGYAALVMAVVRAGLVPMPLAAAGRMAFTNYVACSVIGTTLAAGHGGGLLGEATLQQAMIVVGATWAAILVASPLWLAAFRYGPLEWAWRSLTYGEAQPFRRRRSVEAEPVAA